MKRRDFLKGSIISMLTFNKKEENKDKKSLEGKTKDFVEYNPDLNLKKLDVRRMPSGNYETFSQKYQRKFSETKLEEKTKLIWELGEESGISPYFISAIISLETGYGKSDLVKEKNNVAGMKISEGYMEFKTIKDSIKYLYKLLNEKYLKYDLNTPKKIEKKYCPSCDDWAEKIEAIMKDFYED
jgi:flagellum-specific peptidoglycan hydrolase FlgJ